MLSGMKQHAPATTRNREPITEVLRKYLPDQGTVLEIASGTGEHVLYFANEFGHLFWQPSDADRDALVSIDAWAKESIHTNIAQAICLDASEHPWPVNDADFVICTNMIHISPWRCCEGLMQGAAQVLSQNGVLFLYGPFFSRRI